MDMIIEFGSNACKVMQCDNYKVLLDYRIPLRLISHLDENGNLSEAAMQSMTGIVEDILGRFPKLDRIILVGTEALRRAQNIELVQEKIHAVTGLPLRILSWEEEARATFKGISSGISAPGRILAFDIGGASTEIIYANAQEIQDIVSLPMGVVEINNKFRSSDPYTWCAFNGLELYITRYLRIRKGKDYTVIGTGGSISTMAAVATRMKSYDAEALNATVLDRKEIFRQILLYRSLDSAKISQIPGMDPARADLMPVASLMVHTIMQKANVTSITVSTRGVRHGVLCNR